MIGRYPTCSMCSGDLIPDDGELCGACAKAVSATAKEMIAAAEERGRVEKLTLADAKALAMEARTESLRVVLTEAAKAQQEASDVTFAMASESGRGWDPDAHLMPIAEAILGAEERGRRSGVEAILPIIRGCQADLRPIAVQKNLAGDVARLVIEKLNAAVTFTKLDAAHAPRDSAPQPGISDEKIRELLLQGERDRRIAEGNNVAPRDSGKET